MVHIARTMSPKPTATGKRPSHETREPAIRQAILRKVPTRLIAKGELHFPALPALADHYTQLLDQTWRATGRLFKPEELAYLRQVLCTKSEEAFAASPYSRISVTYETNPPPETSLTWTVNVRPSTIEEEYQEWVNTRTPPLFGEHPDAKAIDVAANLGVPQDSPILDVGAGTGRNCLPLAAKGHPVDAVELAPSLAQILRTEVEGRGLALNVFEGNFLDTQLPLPLSRYKMLLASEVLAHFRTAKQVHDFFVQADRVLAPGGLLVASVFLAHDGYKPDEFARQMSQATWCSVFTKGQLAEAAKETLLEFYSNESCLEYEKASLPAEQWPPSGWYENWAAGRDLFDLTPGKCPMEMRWVVYRKGDGR